jgi:hypothetical protein
VDAMMLGNNPDNSNNFESPRASIQGIKESIAQIKTACELFCGANDAKIIVGTDVKTNEKVVYVRLKNKFSPGTRSAISMCIKTLRIALDQAICASVTTLNPNASLNNLYFPIRKHVADFEKEIRKLSSRIHPDIISICTSLKPHYGEDSDGILWALSHLANLTHRTITDIRPQDGNGFLQTVVSCTGPLQISINKWDPSRNQFEIARLQSEKSRIEFQNNFAFPIEIIFSAGNHPLAGRPLLPSLNFLLHKVEDICSKIEIKTLQLR